MPHTTPGQPTVTTGQVAQAFSVNRKTVQRWNATGVLHGTWVGREMRYTQAEIDRLARHRLIGASAR